MRDVGILIWVVFLIVGVVGSMVSSARRQLAAKPPQGQPPQSPPGGIGAQQGLVQAMLSQMQAQAAPAPPPRPVAPRPARPKPAPAPRSEPPAPPQAHQVRRRSLFGTGPELVRAVIAAEVLGKPRGLNDEYR